MSELLRCGGEVEQVVFGRRERGKGLDVLGGEFVEVAEQGLEVGRKRGSDEEDDC